MTETFLRYSLRHNRPVRVLFAEDMKYRNITVVLLEGDTFTYITSRTKKAVTLPLSAILAAGYARGDHGETESI